MDHLINKRKEMQTLAEEWWRLTRLDNEEDDERVEELAHKVSRWLMTPGGAPGGIIINWKWEDHDVSTIVIPDRRRITDGSGDTHVIYDLYVYPVAFLLDRDDWK